MTQCWICVCEFDIRRMTIALFSYKAHVDAPWHVIKSKREPSCILTLVVELLHTFLPHVDIDIKLTKFETVSYA